MSAPTGHVDRLRYHWWWRPGWRESRHVYACHFTMQDQPGLQRLAATYQRALSGIGGLDLIPTPWLHLSMQEVGFLDEIPPDRIEQVAAVAAGRLAALPAPVVTFHRPVVRPEAVYLPAEPGDGILAVRKAVRQAVGAVLGRRWLKDAGEVKRFRPHVSVAYSTADQPADPIIDTLAGVDPDPVPVTLEHVDLLEYHRDRRMYEWTSARPLAIGPPQPTVG